MYENYLKEMETLFYHLDKHKRGFIMKQELLAAVKKLRIEEIATLHELRVPDPDELDYVFQTAMIEERSTLKHDEFITAMYKVTLEN